MASAVHFFFPYTRVIKMGRRSSLHDNTSYILILRLNTCISFRGGSRIFSRGGGGAKQNRSLSIFIMRITGEVIQLYTEC